MKIIEKLKKYGIKTAFRYVGRKVFKTEVFKVHYLRLTIDIDNINKKLEGFDLQPKELVYEDFLKGDTTVFNGAKLELYKKRFEDSTYRAYGIFENDKLIYSTWVSLHRLGMNVETSPIYLLENEGYLEDSYCDPIARGRGLHGKMNNYRIKKIYETGRNRVIAIVQDGNIPALKVQAKSGFEVLGAFYHGIIFGRKFNTLKKSKFDDK